MKRIESCEMKECIICKKQFTRLDNPRCFNRMITCGRGECTAKRRYRKVRENFLASQIVG